MGKVLQNFAKIITTRKNWLSPKSPKLAGAALRLQGFVLVFSATPVFSAFIVILQTSFVSRENISLFYVFIKVYRNKVKKTRKMKNRLKKAVDKKCHRLALTSETRN